ncbi:MAG TPA: peptide ABC transporter substrate-binding protein [Candidatus Baltobacteraceae bacterium]|nr:peptide ABC transporter substrate-binding protein [Candidatus Baltobacteraceae bacterium]
MRVRCVRVAAAALLVVLAVLPAGCSKRENGQTFSHPNELTIALPEEPVSMDPLLLEGTLAYTIGDLLYTYLTNYDENGNVVPDVSDVPTPENGGVSDGGRRITFHLRHDVKWQDGTPLTSKDVVFTYRAIMNPNNAIPSRYGYDGILKVSAPDAYTVVVQLKQPFSPIIPQFFGGDSNYPILPEHVLGKYASINKVPFNEAPIGSGPYVLKSWTHGDRLVLTANPLYYRGKPAIERLTLPFIHDPATIVNELMTGEVDASFSLDASRISLLRDLAAHRAIVTPIPYFYALSFNTQDPALADADVRRALAMAIDRQAIVRKISHGVYDPRTGLRGLFTWAFDPNADHIPYDPQLAKRLLHGKHLQLQLTFPAGSEITTQLATAIAADEAAIGVTVTLKHDLREIFIAQDGPVMQGHYQISLYDYHSNYDPDAAWLLACAQRAPAGFNDARYCNPAVDRALQKASTVYGRSARSSLYRDVQTRLIGDLPYFFLCQGTEIDVIPSALQHFERPLLSPFNSVARWSLGGGGP